MEIFADLLAEYDRLEGILNELADAAWSAPSAAPGWTVSDVVLHLAQTEEAVITSVRGRDSLADRGTPASSVDAAAAHLVEAERTDPAATFERWRVARREALRALEEADPQRPLVWVAAPLKPATLATTRLAEHWAHGLDITGPLDIPFPDTDRLRHIAWLGHATLPYAFALAGLEPRPVRCELTAPDGAATWTYGPTDAESRVTGAAGAFCRVGAQRLPPEESGLDASGPHATAALRVVRNYAS